MELLDGSWHTWVGIFLILFSGIGATGAGVGGGALYIPIFLLVFSFNDENIAIPLAKATVFGAACAMFVFNVRKRRPDGIGPLIAYDAVLLLEPPTLLGTLIGVRLNKVFPFWIIGILLFFLMFFITFKTSKKAFRMHRKEIKNLEIDSENSPLCNGDDSDGNDVDEVMPSCESEDDIQLINSTKHRCQYPVLMVLQVWFSWGVVLAISLIAGGHQKSIVGVECGSWQYWLVLLFAFPILIIQTSFNVLKERRRHKQLVELEYDFTDQEIQWTSKNTFLNVGASFAAGICSAMMGIGGSSIKGPLLLKILQHPRVASATAGFMLLTTSASSMVQFIIISLLPWKPALVFIGIGFIAGMGGHYLMDFFIGRYRRFSIIVFVLAGYLGIGLVAMGSISILKTIRDFEHNNIGFVSLCSIVEESGSLW